MLTLQATTQGQVVENVVELARDEAEILARLACWRPPGRVRRVRPLEVDAVTPGHLVRWSRQIAEALVQSADITDTDPGTAFKVWSRVRALLMMYDPNWTVDEFVIFHLTRDQYGRFPYGLAASDLTRLAEGRFPASRIRTVMRRLARRGLIKACHTKRSRPRPGSRLPTYEFVWFYSGPSSKYNESPDLVYYMHTPWDDRPREDGAA
jgi:hypothetical protein